MSHVPVPQVPGEPDHDAPERYDRVADSTVEPKVRAATVSAGGSAAILTPFVLWVLDRLFFGGGELDVPVEVVGVVGLVVTGACTFAAGWYARHVQR